MSWSLVRYVLTAAFRDRLILSLILLLVVGVSLSIFMGSATIVEKDRFAVVFAGSGLRLAGVLGLVLFVVFFIRRSFEARDVEFLLSRPIGRTEFLLSYAAGFSLLALGMSAAEGFCLYMLGPHLFGPGAAAWVVSMAVENIIMVNAALFFSMILGSAATAAMASAGFYVLARMMGQLLGIVDSYEASGMVYHLLERVLEVISALMPRLDLMAQSSWLVYGVSADASLAVILAQGAVFAALVIFAALIDLARRQF